MKKKFLFLPFLIALLFSFTPAFSASAHSTLWESHPFYIGIEGGWGCTDWSQLRVRATNADEYATLSLSAPITAGDKGITYGVMVGYEISPHFALEANYMRFPNTPVYFEPEGSLYFFDNGLNSLRSSTYVYNAVGKFMVEIRLRFPHTNHGRARFSILRRLRKSRVKTRYRLYSVFIHHAFKNWIPILNHLTHRMFL